MLWFTLFTRLRELVRDQCGTEGPVSDPRDNLPPMLWTEDAPTHCPHGHPLGPGRVLVGWDAGRTGSLDRGRRIFICRQCDTVMPWKTRSRLE